MEKFSSGQSVILKSGGPKMIVRWYTENPGKVETILIENDLRIIAEHNEDDLDSAEHHSDHSPEL